MPHRLVSRLRRDDPGLSAVRHAARVTVVACLGFYGFRYGWDQRVAATYALFGAIALGAFSQISGGPKHQARTLLAVLPVGWVLISAGTLLGGRNLTAALGMLVVGFVVSYAGVGGPRIVGVANGLLLLYILACFPPYHPASLPERLLGFTIAVGLLIAASFVLWPDPVPETYEGRLATVVAGLAQWLRAESAMAAGAPPSDAVEAIRPSKLPPPLRPASAGRRDLALSHAGGMVRYIYARASDLARAEQGVHELRPATTVLLGQSADAAAAWLRGQGPVPDGDAMPVALAEFRVARQAQAPDGRHPDELRRGSIALAIADGIAVLVTAIRVAAGAPVMAGPSRSGSFWYAGQPTYRLWWRRVREHLTPRSVYFQGALRLAIALALARLLAGALDVAHGFWVLLAILTVLRASAAATRAQLWPSLLGTVIGAVLAGLLLGFVNDPTVYVVLLPVIMLIGFAAAPMFGQVAGQALFTVVIATVFAQLGPSTWKLAEVRLLDVALGGTIGVLIGLCAWPRGGAGEMHRASGNFLADSANTIRETVRVLTAPGPPGHSPPPLTRARRDGQLAEASFGLYQSESGRLYAPTLDWQATLIAGHHVVRGAEGLLRSCPTGRLTDCVAPLGTTSDAVAAQYATVAEQLLRQSPVDVPPVTRGPQDWPRDLGPDLYHLADLREWLDGVSDDLTRIDRTPSA